MKIVKKKSESKVDEDRLARAMEVMKKVNKALGYEGKITLGRDATPIQRTPTNLLTLDYLMTGGVPRGRYIEEYGDESTGKSLLSSIIMAAFQQAGELVLFIPREEADYHWMSRIGVDTSKLLIVEAALGDASLEAATTMIEEADIGLVVMDSIQSFQTKREAEGSVEDEAYGNAGAPQLWGRVMRKGFSLANMGKQTSYLGISQARTKIGGFSRNGPPDSEPTSIKAIRHWKSISLQCKKGEALFQEGKAGHKSLLAREFRLKVRKNKTGVSDREASYWFTMRPHDGKKFGLDYAEDAFRMARVYEVITNNGAWYYLNGERFAQGESAALERLRADDKLLRNLRGKVAEMIKAEVDV